MTDLRDNLLTCFAAVFPTLPPDRLVTASQSTVTEWDSLATVTLLNLVEEQLGIKLPDDAAEHLTSFAEALAYVQARTA
jgi:acyl carrier protein